MLTRAILAALLMLLGCIPAQAQDRLVPPREPRGHDLLDGYAADVRRIFHEALADDVEARVVIRESFAPEVAVGLRARGDGYELFALTPVEQVWEILFRASRKRGDTHSVKAAVSATLADLKLIRCSVPIGADTGRAMLAVWRTMLAEVRPEEQLPLGLDGTSYDFSMPGPGGERTGAAWSPPERSRTGRLVALAEAMRDACRAGHADQPNLNALAAELR